MTTDPIKVDYTTTADLSSQLLHLSLALENTAPALLGTEGQMAVGAGEFAMQVSFGVAEFELFWKTALATMSQGCAITGNNITNAVIDLTAVDVAYSSDIQL